MNPDSFEEFAQYFCWRMAPKLLELPEYNSLPEPDTNPCLSCIQQWIRAIVELLGWADNGMKDVSQEFKDFYYGLLYFQNVYDSAASSTSHHHHRLQKQLLEFTFEVYGSNPRGLPKIIDEMLRHWELLPQAVREDPQANLWNIIEDRGAPAHFAVATLQNKLRRGLSDVKRQAEGTSFTRAKTYYDKLGDPFQVSHEHMPIRPMFWGLNVLAYSAYEIRRRLFRGEQNMADVGSTVSHDGNTAQDDSTVSSKAASTENKIHLYVGPSGCGKTHKLRQLLKRHWGLYLVAGNLSPRPQSDGQQPHEDQAFLDQLGCQARRSGGSRDTHTWYNDLKMMVGIVQYKLSCEFLAGDRFKKLLHIRFRILEDFLQLYPERRTPAAWLNFQTTLEPSGRDIFNDLFRISRFVVAPELVDAMRINPSRKSDEAFHHGFELTPSLASNPLICIDEAQCDLVERFPSFCPYMDSNKFLYLWFFPFSSMVEIATYTVFQILDTNSCQMAISGTALRIEPTINSLMQSMNKLEATHRLRELWRRDPTCTDSSNLGEMRKQFLRLNFTEHRFQMPQMSLESKFELVQEDSQFEGLLMGRIAGCKAELREMIIEHSKLITEHSRPLRGRYQWSVSYVEKIKEKAETDSQVSGEEVARCCRRIYNMAKDGLKRRLKEIDERFWQELSNAIRTRSYQNRPTETEERFRNDLSNAIRTRSHQNRFTEAQHTFWEELSKAVLTQSYQHRPTLSDPAELREHHDRLTEPVNELCWLAIRSDLLGESSIFQSTKSVDLVEQGFAFVERKRHDNTNAAEQIGQERTDVSEKVVLKERIAVEAAVEYFQAERANGRPSRYDEALKRSFYQEQGNISALGRKAELFFAWHLRKVLRAPEQHVDAILPTFSKSQRMEALKLLVGQSENIDKLLQPRKHGRAADARFETRFGCDPDKMCLIEGSQTAFEEKSDSGRSETMWGWLETIRIGSSKGSPKSTFWFPSTMAGPDVLFALRRTPIHQRSSLQSMRPDASGFRKRPRESGWQPGTIDDSIVLCAVQIKRQSIDHDIPGAILSTSPNHWFRSVPNPEEAKSILHELKEWQKKGHPIIRILVTALTDPPGNDPRRKKPMQYLKEENTKPTTRDRFKRKFPKTEDQSSNPRTENNSEDFEASEIPLHQQYFNWIGAEHDGNLFGTAFREFNRAERNV